MFRCSSFCLACVLLSEQSRDHDLVVIFNSGYMLLGYEAQ